MIIIGITGTIGAGKGTVVDYLVSHKNFAHYSARAFITEEVLLRGLPVNRDTVTATAKDMREKTGPCTVAEALYKKAYANGQNAIIESLRNTGEVSFLKGQANFFLLGVDADRKVRYERIVKRNSDLDHVTYEKFISDEEREMTATDPFSQNIKGCMDLAGAIVRNDGTLEELYVEVDKALAPFFKHEHID